MLRVLARIDSPQMTERGATHFEACCVVVGTSPNAPGSCSTAAPRM